MSARFHNRKRLDAEKEADERYYPVWAKVRKFKRKTCMAAGALSALFFVLWLVAPADAQNPFAGNVTPPWWWNNSTAAGAPEAAFLPTTLDSAEGLEQALGSVANSPWGALGGWQQEITGGFVMLMLLVVCLLARAPPDVVVLVLLLFSIVLPAAAMAPIWFYGLAVILAGYIVAKAAHQYQTGGGAS